MAYEVKLSGLLTPKELRGVRKFRLPEKSDLIVRISSEFQERIFEILHNTS